MNIQEQAISIAALLVAITTIGIFTYRVYKIARRIDDALGVDKRSDHSVSIGCGERLEQRRRIVDGGLDAKSERQ